MKPKYPSVKVKLTGYDGNAFTVMGRVTEALRKNGVSKDELDQYREESVSGDYDNLLRTAQKWVTVS